MATIDKSNMLKVLQNFGKQIDTSAELGSSILLDGNFDKVLVCGMGGSALPGDLLACYATQLPVFIHRDYDLPEWVDKSTLIFAISYSGNTEETLSAYRSVLGKNLTAIAISAGGELKKIARKGMYVEVPSGLQPRMAIGYLFMTILNVLGKNKIISIKDDIKQTVAALQNLTLYDHAQEMAAKIENRIPVIYASHKNYCVARVWKIAFNENAKCMAFWNELPELDHNELMGSTELYDQNYFFIFISDESDHKRVKDRFLATKKILKEKAQINELRLSGTNRLTKLLMGIFLGHLTSYYLAISRGIDPTPVKLVEQLKDDLGRTY